MPVRFLAACLVLLVAPPASALAGSTLTGSTLLGGNAYDHGESVAADAEGNAIVAAWTSSGDMVATPGAASAPVALGRSVGMVARIAPNGAQTRLSLIGGSAAAGGASLVNHPEAVAVDAEGNAYVTGTTNATDFPATAGAFQPAHPAPGTGATVGFVAKLDPAGAIAWATYLGGSGGARTSPWAIDLDAHGDVVVAGYTEDPAFPTTTVAGAQSWRGDEDAFVSVLNPAGSGLVWSRLLGGQYLDQANGVAVDGAGGVVIAGQTVSSDFPTTAGAYDTTAGEQDAIVARFAGATGELDWSTRLGSMAGGDLAFAVDADEAGGVYVGGSAGPGFPVTSGAQSASFRPFAAKLAPGGHALAWSALLPGSGEQDAVFALAVDAQHRVWTAGRTDATDLPVTPNADTTLAGYQDGFAVRWRADGSGVDFGTHLGGNGAFTLPEYVHGVGVAPGGRAWLVGETDAADFPVTAGASRRTMTGITDGFASLVDPAGTDWPGAGGAAPGGTTAGQAPGSAAPALGGKAADRTSPRLRARLERRKRALRLTLTLSEPATVQLDLRRLATGRRQARRCVKARRLPPRKLRCTRDDARIARSYRLGAGVSRRSIVTRRGRYAARLVATDAGGNRGSLVRLAFRG